MSADEKFARMQDLYVTVCTYKLGDYSISVGDAVAEYFELRVELMKELKDF